MQSFSDSATKMHQSLQNVAFEKGQKSAKKKSIFLNGSLRFGDPCGKPRDLVCTVSGLFPDNPGELAYMYKSCHYLCFIFVSK